MTGTAALDAARSRLARAERVVVVTGAGMSAESGVPTFRGPGGLWKRRRPEQLATPAAFEADPRLVWEWYGWRREVVAGCEPHTGHLALARAARDHAHLRIVTQNVDGMHALAARRIGGGDGSGCEATVELHGSLFGVRCTRCAERYVDRAPVDARSRETLPSCRVCRALLRPDVVWFGESLDPERLDRAFELAAAADVCVVVGTSALVQPAASVPAATAAAGGSIIEINPEPTPLSDRATIVVRGSAAQALPVVLGHDAGC